MKEHVLSGEQLITAETDELGDVAALCIYHRVYSQKQGHILPPALVLHGPRYHNSIPRKTTVSFHSRDYPLDALILAPRTTVADQLTRMEKQNTIEAAHASTLRQCPHIYIDTRDGTIVPVHPYSVKNAITSVQSTIDRFKTAKDELSALYSRGAHYILIDGNHRALGAHLAGETITALEAENDQDIETFRRMAQTGELFNYPHGNHSFDDLVELFYDFCVSHPPRTAAERSKLVLEHQDCPPYFKR